MVGKILPMKLPSELRPGDRVLFTDGSRVSMDPSIPVEVSS